MADDKAPDEIFCRSCGEPIKEEAEICPECGVRNTAGSGTSLGQGSLDVEEALRNAYGKTKARTGLVLIAAFFVIQLASTVASQSSTARTLEQMDQLPPFMQDTLFEGAIQPGPLAFELPQSLITLLSLATTVLSIAAAIVAYRVFASNAREKIPEEAYKRNIGMATLNGIVAGFVFGVLVVIGFLLLIVPGIYLITALAFFLVFVALEDESFIDSLSSSWELTEGRRLSVFLLFVAIVLVQIVAAVFGGIASAVASFAVPELGALVEVAVGAALSVYSLAVLTEAYFQLRGESSAEMEGMEGA